MCARDENSEPSSGGLWLGDLVRFDEARRFPGYYHNVPIGGAGVLVGMILMETTRGILATVRWNCGVECKVYPITLLEKVPVTFDTDKVLYLEGPETITLAPPEDTSFKGVAEHAKLAKALAEKTGKPVITATQKPTCISSVSRESRRSYSGIVGNPKVYEPGVCGKRAKYVLVNRDGEKGHFCGTHERLALEGFIGPRGGKEDPRSIADVRKYEQRPPHKGVWTEKDD